MESHPNPLNSTFEDLTKRRIIEYLDHGCLGNTHQAGNSRNKGWGIPEKDRGKAVSDDNFLNGTTFWINEHMAVGHMMYDIALMEAMQAVKIDRIVLQRAACGNANQCVGVGTWDGWFKGYFTAIVDAFRPGTPVFIRMSARDPNVHPHYLTSDLSLVQNINNATATAATHIKGVFIPIKSVAPIHLRPTMCFERMVRHTCLNCFFNSINSRTARKFKQAAYKQLTTGTGTGTMVTQVVSRSQQSVNRSLNNHNISSPSSSVEVRRPFVIQLAYRGPAASRHIENIDFLISTLAKAFPSPKYVFRHQNTSDSLLSFVQQLRMAAEADVVLAEHGAFQSNIIYMRSSALFLEWRGNYNHREHSYFEMVAQMFAVHYTHVVTKGLAYHAQDEFNITTEEATLAIDVINQYFSDPTCIASRQQLLA